MPDDAGADPQAETFLLRSKLLAALPEVVRSFRARKKSGADVGRNLMDLFGGGVAVERPPLELPDVPCLPVAELLAGELETLGFYVSASPVERWGPLIEAMATHDVATAPVRSTSPLTLGGVVGNLKLKAMKKSRSDSNRMARFTLEDGSGSVPAMMWPDVYLDHAGLIANGSAVFVSALPNDRDESRELVVSRAIPARMGGPRFTRSIGIAIGDTPDGWPDYDPLIDFALAHPGPMPLLFRHGSTEGDARRVWHEGSHLGVKLGAAMIDDAESRFGPANVYLIGPRGCVSREYLMTVEG